MTTTLLRAGRPFSLSMKLETHGYWDRGLAVSWWNILLLLGEKARKRADVPLCIGTNFFGFVAAPFRT